MTLEREIEVYKQKLPELKDSEGKYVLIHGEEIEVFGTYEDAVRAGYQKCGLTPFLVKQIQSIEQVQFISRLVAPCARI